MSSDDVKNVFRLRRFLDFFMAFTGHGSRSQHKVGLFLSNLFNDSGVYMLILFQLSMVCDVTAH